MKTICFCSFCNKELTNLPQYRPGDRNVYCNVQCHTLFKFSDMGQVPPFPHPEPLKPIHPTVQPFDKEMP